MVQGKVFGPRSLEGWRRFLGFTVSQWNATILLFKEVGTRSKRRPDEYRWFFARHGHALVPNIAKSMNSAEWDALIALLERVRLLKTGRSKKTRVPIARFLIDPKNIPRSHRPLSVVIAKESGDPPETLPKRRMPVSARQKQLLAALREDFPQGVFRTKELDQERYDFESRSMMLRALGSACKSGMLVRIRQGQYRIISNGEEEG